MEDDDTSVVEGVSAVEGSLALENIPLHSTTLLTVLDETGIIQYESPAIERLYGFSQEALLGEQVAEYVHPDDREDVVAAFQAVVSGDDETVESVEYRHRCLDGSYTWVESIASTNQTPEGYYVANTRDVSKKKAREQKLERFEQAIQSAGHAVFITDVDGRIEYVNPAFEAITGYAASDAIGSTPRILKSGEMPDSYYDSLWETILSGEVWTEEIINRRKCGERYHADQTIAPIIDDDNEVTAFVSIQTDVTERKHHEAEIRDKNERLEKFASVLSHDLRNPLTVAQLRAELLRDEYESPHIDAIERACGRMDVLIDDLLSLARANSTDVDSECVDLEALANQCWQTVETANATLSLEPTSAIIADRTRLQQLLENLFRNAIEHGGKNVSITIGNLPDTAGFFLTDDGNGLRDTGRERLFERGYSTTDGGTGFGLAIVADIAEAHEWTITATDSETGGARFEISNVEVRPEGC